MKHFSEQGNLRLTPLYYLEHIPGHVILSLLQCQKRALRVGQPVKTTMRHTAPAIRALLQEKEHTKSVLNNTVVTSCFNSLSLQKETATS